MIKVKKNDKLLDELSLVKTKLTKAIQKTRVYSVHVYINVCNDLINLKVIEY